MRKSRAFSVLVLALSTVTLLAASASADRTVLGSRASPPPPDDVFTLDTTRACELLTS